MIQLLTALQSRESYSAYNLAEMLNISKRMLFRDLNELKKIGVPYNYDKKSRGYKIDPSFFFSTPTLETQEALGLLLFIHKLRNNIRIPFGNSAFKAALKIESKLPEKLKRFCQNALDKILIKPVSLSETELLDHKFSEIIDFILNKQIITFKYKLPGQNEAIIGSFCPYKLVYNNNRWYLVGKTLKTNSYSVYQVNYISELYKSEKVYIEDNSFNLHDLFGRAWSMIPEGKIYNIKLKFSPEVAPNVCDFKWHSTQKQAVDEDGFIIMEFRVDGLNEITWWILGFGDKVQVLAPDILREKIIGIAGNIVKQNT